MNNNDLDLVIILCLSDTLFTYLTVFSLMFLKRNTMKRNI